ncbi:diguanylate cyclase [Catenovulum sp. SM1970]|uniref:diguanylate cyclase n=1 Tax=Marinifaba aquimaris TaxID=2741323 RepID=UPI001573C87C|nr:diguanylate cyclase [Marinifaba aquimaris]NTS75765.1 diguanylate cyclase [Marinifaba aquimaris]
MLLSRLVKCALVLWLLAFSQSQLYALELTEREQRFLQQHPIIKMCVDPNWMPYEKLDDDNNHIGFAADYLNLVAERAGFELEVVATESWLQTLQYARQRRCDIISMARDTEQRREHFVFSQSYTSYPFVIATRYNKTYVDDFNLIKDRTFAVVDGYAVVDYMQKTFPSTPLVKVENIEQGFEKVRNGDVFGYIDSTLAIGFHIQQLGSIDIKVSGQLNFSSSPSIAIRNDMPALRPILNKALDSISAQDRQAIYNRWVSVRFDKGVDFQTVMELFSIASVLLIATLYWTHHLSKAKNRAQDALAALNAIKHELELKNKELERLATRDVLTGLFNRLKIEDVLEQELERVKRFQSSVSLIIMDLDHFKSVNDDYGHQTGDLILQQLAELLLMHTRKVDLVGRWGGEEFIIVCPETDLVGAEILANKIRFEIEQFEFAQVGHKTSSFGLTTYRESDDIDSLIARADHALYQAKENGRNLVEMA